jgi:hypothetical protein
VSKGNRGNKKILLIIKVLVGKVFYNHFESIFKVYLFEKQAKLGFQRFIKIWQDSFFHKFGKFGNSCLVGFGPGPTPEPEKETNRFAGRMSLRPNRRTDVKKGG